MTERVAGLDKRSHDGALGRAMREVPNMKMNMNGEIRDRTTMQYALHRAESRHLCVSELHASKAIQAVQRILNIFREAGIVAFAHGGADGFVAVVKFGIGDIV